MSSGIVIGVENGAPSAVLVATRISNPVVGTISPKNSVVPSRTIIVAYCQFVDAIGAPRSTGAPKLALVDPRVARYSWPEESPTNISRPSSDTDGRVDPMNGPPGSDCGVTKSTARLARVEYMRPVSFSQYNVRPSALNADP